jgi:hypothetical protein
VLSTLGARASAAWLAARGLDATRSPHWYVEIVLGGRDALDHGHFELDLYPEEWGFVFRSGRRVSSIRITDQPFVHGSDDHALLAETPPLERVGDLVRAIERKRRLPFQRDDVTVRSDLARAEAAVRAWVNTL